MSAELLSVSTVASEPNTPFEKLCYFIKEHNNTPLTPEQIAILGPYECMYRDKNKHSIYTMWKQYQPDIEMPEPMKHYDPYTVTPKSLTYREY